MKIVMVIMFLSAACTAEFNAEDVTNDEGENEWVAEEVEEARQEALDGSQEAEGVEAGEIMGEDGNGEEGAIEDLQDTSGEDSVEGGPGEDMLEDIPDEAGDVDLEIVEEDADDEPEPCGGCEEGYRCYGGVCAKECETTEDCTDRCLEGEICHPLGVCIGGTPIDCADGEGATVDGCYSWAGDAGDPCCHICDYWHHPCTFHPPLWEDGHLVRANSMEGTFVSPRPRGEVFTGPCHLSSVRIIEDETYGLALQLIDGDRVLSTFVVDAEFYGEQYFHHQDDYSCYIILAFSATENSPSVSYECPRLLPTIDPECLFEVASIGMGGSCKVCNPGAEVSEYAGCPW